MNDRARPMDEFVEFWDGGLNRPPGSSARLRAQEDELRARATGAPLLPTESAPPPRRPAAIVGAFGVTHAFLPVIHYADEVRAVASVDTAMTEGAHGVWLINQGVDVRGLIAFLKVVRERHPAFWLGVNLLGKRPTVVFRGLLVEELPDGRPLLHGVQGLWSDHAFIEPAAGATAEVTDEAREFARLRTELRWAGHYYGGVAHKGSALVGTPPQPHHWGPLARAAVEVVDVVTTSGESTGVPPPVAKVRAMRAALAGLAQHVDTSTLALASGISAENVGAYQNDADAFLVASSIERSFGELDPVRVRALADLIRGWA